MKESNVAKIVKFCDECSFNLIKGIGMTIEELFEKFGTEIGEEELFHIRQISTILDHYEYIASEKQYWTEKEKEIYGEAYIFRVKDLWEIKKMLVDVAKEYLAMSEEDLSDVTPFDVLNDINKLI